MFLLLQLVNFPRNYINDLQFLNIKSDKYLDFELAIIIFILYKYAYI